MGIQFFKRFSFWMPLRRIAAIFFLLVIFLNGGVEFLFLHQGPVLQFQSREHEADSEVSDVTVACSCTCCGPVCPMGAACCCDAPKTVKVPAHLDGIILIRGDKCHPNGTWFPVFPASVFFRFLPQSSPMVAIQQKDHVALKLPSNIAIPSSYIADIPAPPPRSVA